jgi:hypothetical protein
MDYARPTICVPAILLSLPWGHVLLRLGDTQSVPVNFGLLVVGMVTNAALLWLLRRILSRLWRR